MLRRPFIASGITIVALIIVLLIVSLVLGQRHLRTVQKELGRTIEQVVKLEKVIANQKTGLDAVDKARAQLQSHLDEANSDNDQLRKELDAAQSQLKEKEAQAQEPRLRKPEKKQTNNLLLSASFRGSSKLSPSGQTRQYQNSPKPKSALPIYRNS